MFHSIIHEETTMTRLMLAGAIALLLGAVTARATTVEV